ncbi:uncharacterized protein SCHCODRAFT_02560654 [Schizophyllum commune H4-8]|nr:uncharacterized protein SCHCODRAFT_02560654 [Schizophyllum commune H4-8]KAI5899460.1 hypothetical protein SCHCODRAFT_02560654 [Schizophyllum commune H4-8]
MAETLLETFKRDVSLCNHCEHAVHLQLDVPPSAPNNAILRTNRQLYSVDMMRAEESLEEMEKALLQVEQAKDALQAASRRVERLERELLRRRDAQRAYAAPVRRLPKGIMSEIFQLSCGDESWLNDKYLMPLVLSSVCKSWRDTAHATHSIWADLSLDSWELAGTTRSPVLRRLKLFLSHSGSIPFQRCIVYYRPFTEALYVSQAFEALVEHVQRWTQLFVGLCAVDEGPRKDYFSFKGDFGRIFSHLEGKEFSCLRSLTGDPDILSEGNAKGIFRHLPSLRDVTLHCNGDMHPEVPQLPWEQLEQLDLEASPAYAVDIIRRCSNLVNLRFTNKRREDLDAAPKLAGGPVVLPRLRTLRVFESGGNKTTLLDRLTAPSLEEAILEYDSVASIDKTGFPLFLPRSHCPLRCLILYSSHTLTKSFLALLPELVKLTLYTGKKSTAGFVNMLTLGDRIGLPRFLPSLEELHIFGEIHAESNAMLAMVRARRDFGRPIQTLSLKQKCLYGISDWIDYDDKKFEQLKTLVPNYNIS